MMSEEPFLTIPSQVLMAESAAERRGFLAGLRRAAEIAREVQRGGKNYGPHRQTPAQDAASEIANAIESELKHA